MAKQRRLVGQQPIEATIELVLFDQIEVFTEQIGHRALLEPLPVQAPLAARIDQPITDQGLKDVGPRGAFARSG